MTSTDGQIWAVQVTGITDNLNGVAFSAQGGTYIVVGENGTILQSTDGAITWAIVTTPVATDLLAVTYSQSLSTFVAVGSSGTIIVSATGATWESKVSGVVGNLNGVTSYLSTVLAAGDLGVVVASQDLTNWSFRTTGTVNNLTGITTETFGASNIAFAVGDLGTIITSSDSNFVTWTDTAYPSPTTANLSSVTTASGMVISTGDQGTLIDTTGSGTWSDAGIPIGIEGSDKLVFSPATNQFTLDASILPQTTNAWSIGNDSLRFKSANFSANGVTIGAVQIEQAPTNTLFIRDVANTPALANLTALNLTSTLLTSNTVTANLITANSVTSNTVTANTSVTLNATVTGNANLGNITISNSNITGTGSTNLVINSQTSNVVITSSNAVGLGTGGNVNISGGTGSVGGSVNISAGAGSAFDGNITIGNIEWPRNDGSTNQVLTTDGAGRLSWTTPNAASDYSNVDVQAFLGSGTLNGDIIPAGNQIYDLGSPTNYWKTLYLSGNTIYIGNSTISSNPSANAGNLLYNARPLVSSTVNGDVVLGGNLATPEVNTPLISLGGLALERQNGNITYDSNPLVSLTNGNLNIPGSISANSITSDDITITGNASFSGNVTISGNVTSEDAVNVTGNNQPNITSVGTLTSLTVSGVTELGIISNVHITGGSSGQVLTTDGTGNLSWASQTALYGNANVKVYLNNYDGNIIPATTNQYDLGSATKQWKDLYVGGNTIYMSNIALSVVAGNNLTFGDKTIAFTGTNNSQNLQTTGNVTANVATFSTVNTQYSNLGSVSNVQIFGGNVNQVLSTDGNGGLQWIDRSSGSGPGGPTKSIQFNDGAGNFNGSAYLTYDVPTTTLTVAGNLTANALSLGTGTYSFSRSFVYSAVTNSTLPNQEIYSVDAATTSRVDFVIISTDSTSSSRQTTKIDVLHYNGNINYNETGSLAVNNYLGDWLITYDPGSVIRDPQIVLTISPLTSNTMIHRMMITTYES
jgi:hypothetical protein